jgi:hypothetical protein
MDSSIEFREATIADALRISVLLTHFAVSGRRMKQTVCGFSRWNRQEREACGMNCSNFRGWVRVSRLTCGGWG